jgi:hypothetical protein
MTKARDIADFKFENITDTGTEGTKVASGTTAQRGSTTGQIRFNSTTGLAEYYTGNAFKSIDAPPIVSSLDVTEVDSQAGGNQTIVITGSGFNSGATVTFVGASGTDFNASTVTVNSDTQITAVAPKASFLNAQEPYGVKVINVSGLSATLASQINVDTSPSWQTASGSLGSLVEGTTANVSVSATDADGDTVVYSVQSGSLPPGASLNTSTGAITGTLSDVNGDTTNSFTLRATANSKTSDRAFNIIVTDIPDGTSRSSAIPVSKTENPITRLLANRGESNGSATEGVYWFNTTNTADETYKFPTVIRNFNSNTWLMIGKNYRQHAYKNSNSDANTSGGTASDNNSAHSLSYGLIASNGSALVTNSNILGSSANVLGSSSTLGTYHCAIAIKSFGDNVWSQTCFHGRDGGYRYLSRNDLTDKIHKGQNPSQGIYESDAFYSPDSGSGYITFNTLMTAVDKDTMRLSITTRNTVAHDYYNNANEYYGSTWFQDGADNYLNTNYDNVLGGVSNQNAGYSASTEWGRISIWVR